MRSLQAVEVLDGLKAGDTLLLGNGVQTGQRVRVRDAATAPTASTTPGAPVATAGSAGAAGATLTNAMGR